MRKFTVLNGFSHNGIEYKPGEIFLQEEKNLSDYDVQFLLGYQKITVFKEKKPDPIIKKDVEEVKKVVVEEVKEEVKEVVVEEDNTRKPKKFRRSE